MKRLVDGKLIDMTAEEIAVRQAEEQAWNDGALNRALDYLRKDRNKLLVETDYLALSDNTMSEEIKEYRQQLRDITNGLTTVEEVKAVKFPIKPN
tara:strand:+ start:143 stop:427 length:285 start_codon:yes stop_codon:yes gene_type:complete